MICDITSRTDSFPASVFLTGERSMATEGNIVVGVMRGFSSARMFCRRPRTRKLGVRTASSRGPTVRAPRRSARRRPPAPARRTAGRRTAAKTARRGRRRGSSPRELKCHETLMISVHFADDLSMICARTAASSNSHQFWQFWHRSPCEYKARPRGAEPHEML